MDGGQIVEVGKLLIHFECSKISNIEKHTKGQVWKVIHILWFLKLLCKIVMDIVGQDHEAVIVPILLFSLG